jgi:hypothetical protein
LSFNFFFDFFRLLDVFLELLPQRAVLPMAMVSGRLVAEALI